MEGMVLAGAGARIMRVRNTHYLLVDTCRSPDQRGAEAGREWGKIEETLPETPAGWDVSKVEAETP
jgi:hypothetical protein